MSDSDTNSVREGSSAPIRAAPQERHVPEAVIESAAATGRNHQSDRDTILVIDFGSQYSRLIARRIRECHVYCEVVPHDMPWEQIWRLQPRGLVLSGGPASVY